MTINALVPDYTLPWYAPAPSDFTMREGTSLSFHDQFRLQDAIDTRDYAQRAAENEEKREEESRKLLGKKMGVWVDGTIRLQSRDRDAIDEYAARRMREKHNVWVAPVGSFVTV